MDDNQSPEITSDIFALGGILLEPKWAPSPQDVVQTYIKAMSGRRLHVALDLGEEPDDGNSDSLQYCLKLPTPDKRICGLAPQWAFAYLEYGVFDTFRDIRNLRRPALTLESRGILLLGQLVQMSFGAVTAITGDPAARAMRVTLASTGLDFEIALPGWQRMNAFMSSSHYSR